MFGNKFLKLCFFLLSCFWSHSRNNLVSPHMACSKFRRVNSYVKLKSATSRNLFADRRAGFSVVFSYCLHKMKYTCCLVFSVCFSKLNSLFGFSSRKVSQRSGFIMAGFAIVMRALTADNRKNLTFQIFSLSVLPLPLQNEIQSSIKILLLFELGGLFIWF